MISVVACTNRREWINSIIVNFHKQTLKEKELILVLHADAMDETVEAEGLKILRIPGSASLGECLNRGCELAEYETIAKMDDDDYYGPDFLMEALEGLRRTGADMVGKSSFYIHFKKNLEVRLYNPGRERRWIIGDDDAYKSSYFLSGASMVFKKKMLEKVKFPAVSIGEDSCFQRLCLENGFRFYSLTKEHYAYIRHPEEGHHHSDVSESVLRRRSRFAARAFSIDEFFCKNKKWQ